MPVAASTPRQALPRPLRRWACAGALAAAWMLLVSSEPTAQPGGFGPASATASAPQPAADAAHVARGDEAARKANNGTAAALTRSAARLAGHQDPHPFAPGGDDMLPWDTGAPSRAVQAAAGAVPKPAQAAAGHVAARGVAGVAAGVVALASPSAASSLLLWLDRSRVRLGERVLLHLARNGVVGCRGQGALQALGPLPDRVPLLADTPGQHRLVVRCQGSAGPLERAVTLVVPVPVHASSAENRQRSDVDPAHVPSVWQLGLMDALMDTGRDARAVGDFLQEGRLSLFVAAAGADGRALAFVLARDEQGRWRDRSVELLGAGDERRSCQRPVQALTADFNHDGLPDVYLACGEPGSAPAEPQLLYLSQADGRYRRLELPLWLNPREAEATDVDHDGVVDIVTVDLAAGSPRTLVLRGRGDGSFALDERTAAVGVADAQGRR